MYTVYIHICTYMVPGTCNQLVQSRKVCIIYIYVFTTLYPFPKTIVNYESVIRNVQSWALASTVATI